MYTYLKYDTFDDLSVLGALLCCLGLQVFVNLSWSDHVLFMGHKISNVDMLRVCVHTSIYMVFMH